MKQDLDTLKAALAGWVRSLFPRIDYLARYEAKVIAQNGDGSLELAVDDARFPGFSNVPIRYGVPGVKATVAPGARVLLGFAGGDPAKPEAELWESASVTKLEVTATEIVLNGGTAKVGRVGDAVKADTSMAAWITSVTGALTGIGAASRVPGLVEPTNFGKVETGAAGVKA